MADGSVVIDTKLDTSGLRKMDFDIEGQLKNLERQMKTLSKSITKALDAVDASGMVREIKSAANDIEQLEMGDTISGDIEEGFQDAEQASAEGAADIEEDLSGIGDEASQTGEEVSDKIKEGFRESEKASGDSTEDIEDDLDDVGDKANQTGGIISKELAGAFKGLLSVAALKEAAEALIEFGAECLELGSDLEEVQNVVDVTFETMSDAVNDFAKDAKKSAGLSEKMAKQYVGTFGAMADSFGFTEQEAYEMSTALTQLTGDVASFYNLSQDEAYTKLKSVFTGETEALKDLGVVMTQTALDSYALANGFNKTTSEMTEQEKVALRYQFVMDQLAGASGDFVRTQDSWANQCKLLSLQWESLMAILGSGLIDALGPGIEWLNDTALPALTDFAERFAEAFEPKPSEELADSLEDFQDTIDDVNSKFEETSEQIEFNAIMASNYKKRLDELESSGLDTAESQREYASVVAYLNELYPDLNLQIDEQTGLLDDNSRAQLGNLEAMKQKALWTAMEERYTAALQAQAAAQIAVDEAQAQATQIGNERRSIYELLNQQTGLTVEQLIAQYNAQNLVNDATRSGYGELQIAANDYAALNGTTVTLTESQMALVGQMIALDNEQNALELTIEEGTAAVAEYDVQLQSMAEAADAVAESTGGQTQAQTELTAAAQDAINKVDALVQEYEAAKESARESIDSQIGCFDELVVESDLSTEEIIKNWASQKQGFDNYSANLQKAVDMGLDKTLVKQLSDGSVESMAILDQFVNDTDLDVEEINAAFQETQQSRDTVSGVMAGIQEDTSKKLDEISQGMSDDWDEMADIVGEAIATAQDYIDGLTGKTVYNKIITQYSTQGSPSSGSTTSTTAPAAASAVSVPFLAKGTVIPPNAPFLAVLGDQRHGTNVEAPLSTIQEAVALVMQDQTNAILAGFESSVGVQKEILEAILGIQIGDDAIGSAVARYNTKLSVIRGGG